MKSMGMRELGAVLVISAGISVSAPAVSGRFEACAQKGAPTARVCALKDFGKPLPSNPRSTDEPTWFRDVGIMAAGKDSSLYSTSPSGGVWGAGAAFKMSPAGLLTVLHAFDNSTVDAGGPRSGLVDGGDGYFYGTSYGGGTFKTGTIFRVKGNGEAATVLYSFRNGNMVGLKKPCDDGRCPWSPRQRADAAGSYTTSPMVSDGKGNFYGVTDYSFNQKYGTLYKLSPPYDSTGFRTLCIFDPSLVKDSALVSYICHPKATFPSGLTMDRGSSTLYGTTTGGTGTIFSATTDGKVKVLFDFTLPYGSLPSGLIVGSDGALYGTAYTGGPANLGTVFKHEPATGRFTVLTGFKTSVGVMGYNPLAGVTEGMVNGKSDGFVYGTARYGGRYGRGIIYRASMDGKIFGVVHDFYTTGRLPMTKPVQGRDGNFYGVTYQGGTWNGGTFYRLSHVEYPPRATSPVNFAATKLSKVMKDSLVLVTTSVTATQGGPITDSTNDGISTKITCRDPHFVQFIYREKISTLGLRLPGTVTASSGQYELTTDTSKKVWHSDGVGKPDAYYDEGPKAGYFIALAAGVTSLTIWDQPTFTGPLFPASQQDPRTGETWRATARTFAICNCQVVREIRWTLEKVGGKQEYKDISIQPATDASLGWINAQLKQDGFHPVP